MTRIINIKSGESYDTYIGRGKCPQTGQLSKWANPFKITKFRTRKEAIQDYKMYITARANLLKDLYELKDKTLGCWCVKEPIDYVRPDDEKECHGEVLLELLRDLNL